MADLGRQHRLRARRQRRVAHRDALVVGEVARLLLGGERVAAELHREHEVRLLDDLLPVEVEVGKVKHQRVLVRPRRGEVPHLVRREALRLLVHAELGGRRE